MNLTFFLISSPDSGLVMLFVQAITLTSSFFLLYKITAISNFTNFLYNAYICVCATHLSYPPLKIVLRAFYEVIFKNKKPAQLLAGFY